MAVASVVSKERIVRSIRNVCMRLAAVLFAAAFLDLEPAAAQELLETPPDPFVGIPMAADDELAAELPADDVCMQELRQCCCCPSWTHYAIFDMLFLQRNNAAINRPLVVSGSSSTSVPLITAGDPTSAMATETSTA